MDIIFYFILEMSSVPDFPTNIVAVAAPASAVITWGPPESDGGSPITGYTVVSTPGNKIQTVGPTVNSCTMTGLTNGISYTFQVVAENANGKSGVSSAATPYPPPTIKNFKAAITGPMQITLTWTGVPGAVASPITRYRIEGFDNGSFLYSTYVNADVVSHVLGIDNGIFEGFNYVFKIRAETAYNEGLWVQLAPITAINVPSRGVDNSGEITMTAVPGAVNLSWTRPGSNGGSAITGYIVRYVNNTTAAQVTLPAIINASGTVSLTVPRLVNGNSYTFFIRSRNIVGASAEEDTTQEITPYALPGAPVLTLTPGDSQATLSWTAVAAATASPITGYIITCPTPGVVIPSPITSSPVTITGLTNGTLYTFRINSVSDMGSSAVVSKTVVPATVPSTPLNFTAVSRPAGAYLTWAAPTSNGGSVITGYTVTYGTTTRVIPATPLNTLITALTNGTPYIFNIVARNVMGSSLEPAISSPVTPAAVPSAPVVIGTPKSQAIDLSWSVPANNGSVIMSYTITSVPAAPSSSIPSNITSSPVSVSGLTPGTGYVFSVIAVNAVGNSLPGRTLSVKPTA